MNLASPTIRIGHRFQGPTGSGNGGWSAHRARSAIGASAAPTSVAFRAPIPLGVDLAVVEVDDGWHVVDRNDPDHPVMIVTGHDADFAETTPVPIEAAREARSRFPLHGRHPVPDCFSCGVEQHSMHVHAGELVDGRWATDWTVPDWAIDDAGQIDDGVLWAAIDCAQGWYATIADGERRAVTVQLTVEPLQPLEPAATYSLVAWQGTFPRRWDGRKRGAGGAVFAADGTLVARSSSFWIATE